MAFLKLYSPGNITKTGQIRPLLFCAYIALWPNFPYKNNWIWLLRVINPKILSII